jgi:hypothetical protein
MNGSLINKVTHVHCQNHVRKTETEERENAPRKNAKNSLNNQFYNHSFITLGFRMDHMI